jgi:hypothetical protein
MKPCPFCGSRNICEILDQYHYWVSCCDCLADGPKMIPGPEEAWEMWNQRFEYLGTKPDLDKCPRCGGEADNGHDRCIPPNPYLCRKCSEDDWRIEK